MTSISNMIRDSTEDTSINCTQKWMQDRLVFWKSKMNLTNWQIEFFPVKTLDKDVYFQVKVTRDRNYAAIFYHDGRMIVQEKAELAFVHELAHLLVDNIREEHDFQLSYGSITDKDEYRRRFTREIEKSVETIARSIYYAYNEHYQINW